MDLVKVATTFLNAGQTLVLAIGRSLYAITKGNTVEPALNVREEEVCGYDGRFPR